MGSGCRWLYQKAKEDLSLIIFKITVNHHVPTLYDLYIICQISQPQQRANTNRRKSNFSGFEDMSDWFKERNPEKHRQNAEKWHQCKSNDERKQHVSAT
ncbi:3833_t:CDS:2, partial [Racocetra fulgida]